MKKSELKQLIREIIESSSALPNRLGYPADRDNIIQRLRPNIDRLSTKGADQDEIFDLVLTAYAMGLSRKYIGRTDGNPSSHINELDGANQISIADVKRSRNELRSLLQAMKLNPDVVALSESLNEIDVNKLYKKFTMPVLALIFMANGIGATQLAKNHWDHEQPKVVSAIQDNSQELGQKFQDIIKLRKQTLEGVNVGKGIDDKTANKFRWVFNKRLMETANSFNDPKVKQAFMSLYLSADECDISR